MVVALVEATFSEVVMSLFDVIELAEVIPAEVVDAVSEFVCCEVGVTVVLEEATLSATVVDVAELTDVMPATVVDSVGLAVLLVSSFVLLTF